MAWRCIPLLILLCGVAAVRAAPPASGPASGVPCAVTVDGRIELICVLFRLAGNHEYNRGCISSYERDIEQHFSPHREHDAVKLARRLAHAEHGVGYDAPMTLAVHLSALPELAERVAFDPHPDGLDTRLAPEPTRAFVAAARRFAAETKFDDFLQAHRDLYTLCVERMTRTLTDHAKLRWFDDYFGPRGAGVLPDEQPRPQFHLIIGLQNGHSNYGARVLTADGERHFYSILGAWDVDAEGLPRFGRSVIPIIIHEFGHSYVNPAVDRHLEALQPAGETLFARAEQAMRAQAYGNWPTMMRESVLRACVVRYRLANEGPLAAAGEVAEQTLRGFSWTGGLSGRLAEYEANRDRYPTFDSFVPRIAEYFDDLVTRPDPATRP